MSHRPSPRRRRFALRRWLRPRRRWALVAVLSLAAVLTPSAALGADEPDVARETVLKANADPAVHLVQVTWSGTVVVPVPGVDMAVFDAIAKKVAADVGRGGIGSDEASIVAALVREITKHADKLFVPSGESQALDVAMNGLGTSFAITPDGYLVTAAHVVKSSDEELLNAFLNIAMQEWLVNAAQSLINSSGYEFTEEQVQQIVAAVGRFAVKHAQLTNLSQKTEVDMGVSLSGVASTHNLVAAEVVEVGESYPGKDVAILKVDGYSAMPTVPMAEAGDPVDEGEAVYCSGFPAASTFVKDMSAASELQVNFTTGLISSKRTNDAGTPIYQSQVDISGGNSGGPCLNRSGEVVALAAASAADADGQVAGQAFLIPSSVITEKLKQKNIKAAASQTTEVYAEALDAYYRNHFREALEKFESVRALHPGHPYVDQFVSKATAQVQAGKDETPTFPWLILAIGGGVIALGSLATVVFVLLKRRRAARRAQPPTTPGFPPMGMPQPGMQQPGMPAHTMPTPGMPAPPIPAPGMQAPPMPPPDAVQAPPSPEPPAQTQPLPAAPPPPA